MNVINVVNVNIEISSGTAYVLTDSWDRETKVIVKIELQKQMNCKRTCIGLRKNKKASQTRRYLPKPNQKNRNKNKGYHTITHNDAQSTESTESRNKINRTQQ